MVENQTRSHDLEELRRRAEEKTHGVNRETTLWEQDAARVLHELRVHQLELEMQNEELRRAHNELELSRARYFDLYESAPIGYFTVSEKGLILEVNLRGTALLGVPRANLLKQPFANFIRAEDHGVYFQHRKQLFETGLPQVYELQMLHAEKGLFWSRCESTMSVDAHGSPVCRTVVSDVTLNKQAEEKLTEFDHRKDRFLATLSHELRTPLMPVVLGVSLLQDRPDLDLSTRETLEMVRRNVEMEVGLIDDLLDVARIKRGKIELSRKPSDLSRIIQSAIDVCMPEIEARRLDFRVELAADAPYWVEADAARFQQVVWNLLTNAIKFTPPEGRVGIRCRQDGTDAVLEVYDTGIGIDTKALSRIFDAFEQAERSITKQYGGLGLGLMISKSLVELHGGTIEALSEGLNQGATFRIRLPLIAPPEELQRGSSMPREEHSGRSLHVLLVEDHALTAKLMQMVLAADGHRVETAGDIATALELAGRHRFDLLISDLGLPDGSGHDLMRALRLRGNNVPGIALSGYGQEDDIRRSHEAGFGAHVTKPASRETLLEAIAAATTV